MKEYVRAVAAIVYKDALVELRTRETVVAGSIFALLVAIVFASALQLAPVAARSVAPGLLWVTLAFAGVFAFGRSFAAERDRGCLDGLLLAPVDATALYIGKVVSGIIFMTVVLAVTLPSFSALLGVGLLDPRLLPAALLGVAGFASAGVLFAAVALSGRARDVLLPILFLPLAIPVILTAAGSTRLLLAGLPQGDTLGVLAACTVLYTALGVMLFDYTIEE